MNSTMTGDSPRPYWSPYTAGFGLGLVLLASFLVLGLGLGASGGFARIGLLLVNAIAPNHVQGLDHAAPLVNAGPILKDGMVFGVIGVAIGGFLGALSARRLVPLGTVERGPTTSRALRLTLALVGGGVMGFAARLARGCTSGQALSGGAQLALGSWVFMFAVFGGGFAFAWFVRRQWR